MGLRPDNVSDKKVLVTNGTSLIALAVVRSLARRGLKVFLLADSPRSPISFSRAVCQTLTCPSSKNDPYAFIDVLGKILSEKKFETFFPISTRDTLLVSRHLDQLSRHCRIPFLPFDRVNFLHNKRNLSAFCQNLGLKTPKTIVPENTRELKDISKNLQYPYVIKLADSTGAEGMSFVTGQQELLGAYAQTVKDYNLEESNLPILQQYIPGTGYGVSCLYNRGERRAFFTHKRIRELNPEGGASTCRESIRHPEMEEMAFTLLDHLKWHGVAMVEFKVHQDTERPYILEVNPRFWGSLAAAIGTGVDFPWLLYQMAIEGDVEPINEYPLGIRSRCLLTDAVSFTRHLMDGKLNSPYLKDFFGFHGKKTFWEDISLEDPLPFFQFIFNLRS